MDKARAALEKMDILSAAGVDRLLSVYGGRAAGIATLCESEPALAYTLDDQRRICAAEVQFTLREEFAQTLTDVVFRRMMIGLDADQGRRHYEDVAALAAAEAGWSLDHTRQQLADLEKYAGSWRVG